MAELSKALLVREYVDAGLTCQQIADKHDCTYDAIRRLLRSYGIRRKPYKECPELQDGEWLQTEIVDKGRTQSEVARELGISKQSVQSAIVAFGVGAKRPPAPEVRVHVEQQIAEDYRRRRKPQPALLTARVKAVLSALRARDGLHGALIDLAALAEGWAEQLPKERA